MDEQLERRQGMRMRDGWHWSNWHPCTEAEAQRVSGLQSWEVRNTGKCAACAGTGRVPCGLSAPGQPAPWDASQIKQPGWDHVEAAFVEGAREARANPEADEAMFRRAADGYTKRVFEEVACDTGPVVMGSADAARLACTNCGSLLSCACGVNVLSLIQAYADACAEVAVEQHAYPGDSWKNKQPAADAALAAIKVALGVQGTVKEQPCKS